MALAADGDLQRAHAPPSDALGAAGSGRLASASRVIAPAFVIVVAQSDWVRLCTQ